MSGSIIMPSFRLMFSKAGDKTVYFVTDSQHCSPRQIEAFYARGDMVFQDSELAGYGSGELDQADSGNPRQDVAESLDLPGARLCRPRVSSTSITRAEVPVPARKAPA